MSRRKHKRNKNSKQIIKTNVESKSIKEIFVQPEENKVKTENTTKVNIFKRFINFLKEKQVLSKIFIICFALVVFSYTYFNVESVNRKGLAYIGLILTMLAAYIEILVIRDHLWVIEGSMPESKKWREFFFNPSFMRKQKFRKIIVLLFAFIIFAMVYRLKVLPGAKDTLSFIGLILMVTMVYYEILTIRDEVSIMTRAMQQIVIDKSNK